MRKLILKFKKKVERFKEIHEEEMRESRTIHKDNLKLYLDDKNRVRLYYKENEMTKQYGFITGILSDGMWYYSTDSVFGVKKISPEEMQITSKLHNLPVNQIWNIKITAEGHIRWDAEMEFREPLRMDARDARIFLSKAYSQWVSPLKQEAFALEFDSQWYSMDLPKEACDFIGCVSLKEEYPSITLKTLNDTKAKPNVLNTDSTLSSRVLEIQFEEEKELYQLGTYSFLKTIIQIYPDKTILEEALRRIKEQQEEELRRQEEELRRQEEELRRQEEEQRREEEKIRLKEEQERLRRAQEEDQKHRTLKEGSFRLYFDQQNRIHIHHKDSELTKGFGLNSGILSEGSRYDSSDSEAKIERSASDEMTIYLFHNQLPFTQIWHLKLKPEGILIWDINVHLKEPLRIDRRNASLFLSKVYKDWLAPPKQGTFPSSFNSQWQNMNSFEDKPDFIGLISSLEEFPSVVLKSSDNSKAALLIQNTSIDLSSRTLEIQFKEEKEFYQLGTYSFLKATIQLYPDKAILEDIVKEIMQKQEEERIRQEEEKKQQEEREIKENAFLRFKDAIRAITLSEESSIYVFGDREALHDKISSEPGDFRKTISKIKTANRNNLNIKIGMSRFNFFKLNNIAQFCSRLINRRLDLRSVSLKLFPVKNLYSNFGEYIQELNERIGPNKIKLFLKDEELLDLLWSISLQADQYNEKDLLRLLGIITEHPFIGPQTIVLDTNHRCNTNCIHCWIHTPKRRLTPKVVNLKMNSALYKNIVDDAVKLLCDEIIFQGDGEPLLDSRFFEMVRYARDKGLKVLFFTNGILLDKEKAKKIIDLEINEIFCSLPAGTDKTYALINSWQSKNTFHKVVDNLKNLVSLRNNLKRNKPWLQMSHVIHNLNYHELEEMSKVDAYIRADKVRFYLVRLDENIKSLKLDRHHIEAIKKSLKRAAPYLKKEKIELQDNIYFQLKNYNPITGSWSGNTFLKSGCPVGWFFCLALARGELSMCCHLRTLDSLNGKSLAEIWNSENYNKLRVQAKYLMKNKDVTFMNGVKLYDEFCSRCDTHQVILMINELVKKYKLDKFL